MTEWKKIPVILDADTGVDDTMALILAARHPKLDVLAVTATFGNTTLEYSLKNTLNALAMCGREDIPVASGMPVPWKIPLMLVIWTITMRDWTKRRLEDW